MYVFVNPIDESRITLPSLPEQYDQKNLDLAPPLLRCFFLFVITNVRSSFSSILKYPVTSEESN